MKILPILSLLVLSALTVLSFPVEDISATSVDVQDERLSPSLDHITVTVSRVDDLLTDDGDFLAERVIAVVMRFDVDKDTVTLNGIPLPVGPSSVEIEAAILATPEALNITDSSSNSTDIISPTDEQLAALEDEFDLGLVLVEVTTSVDAFEVEGLIVKRITVIENIVQINGEEVIQVQAGQQILDVYEDGSVKKYIPCGRKQTSEAESIPGVAFEEPQEKQLQAEPQAYGQSCKGNRFHAFFFRLKWWWCKQSLATRFALTGLMGSLIAVFALSVRRLILIRKRCRDGYAVPENQDEIIYEEKSFEKIQTHEIVEEHDDEDVVDEKKGLLA